MLLATPLAVSAQDNAGSTALVSEKGFDCFVRHLGSYMQQGQEIVVNFEDCPSQPGMMQRMEAREATLLLPGVGTRQNGGAEGYQKYMILTPRMARCLRDNAAKILSAAENNLVPLLPEDCGS